MNQVTLADPEDLASPTITKEMKKKKCYSYQTEQILVLLTGMPCRPGKPGSPRGPDTMPPIFDESPGSP
jgi:hypothetical protein